MQTAPESIFFADRSYAMNLQRHFEKAEARRRELGKSPQWSACRIFPSMNSQASEMIPIVAAQSVSSLKTTLLGETC
jgi:hypothetical protein